jgi:hypothetical protein
MTQIKLVSGSFAQDPSAPDKANLVEPNTFFVSQRVALSRAEVIAALSAAALARAVELARVGEPVLRNLTLDAKILPDGGVEILGVLATAEVQIDARAVAALPARPAPTTPHRVA